MQLIGRAFEESHLLSIAQVFDQEHGFGRQAPSL
jgi:Asp-tRNA(Asn)/Glu-tRNA(Gln) amidotransferase A subunit family amidase